MGINRCANEILFKKNVCNFHHAPATPQIVIMTKKFTTVNEVKISKAPVKKIFGPLYSRDYTYFF